MIVAVNEQFLGRVRFSGSRFRKEYHDYEMKQYFLDTDELDKNNYVDKQILKAVAKKNLAWVTIEATNWEEDEKFGGNEVGVTEKAKLKKSDKIDAALYLHINFDC